MMDAVSPGVWLYFAFVVVLGTFFMVNLALAVLYMNFSIERDKQELEHEAAEEEAEQASAWSESEYERILRDDAVAGVSGAASAVRLEVTREGRAVGSSGPWAARPDAAAIASAATRVGAFPLAPGSEDAALLLDLEPGAYTAVVATTANASGVALI